MIFLNGDILECRRYSKAYALVPYKGQMSNSLLVVEDVVDFSKKNPENHKCMCKCLKCGKIYPRLVTVRQIREGKAKCYCSGQYPKQRYKFLDKKGEMLRFLVSERNKAKSEAVFAEDEERLQKYDLIIHFLQSASLKNYFNKRLDL